MTPRNGFSLRTRLIAGVGLIVIVAILGASLAVFGTRETNRRIDALNLEQRRIETLSLLSASVNDYGVLASRLMRNRSRSREERLTILESSAQPVDDLFDELEVTFPAQIIARENVRAGEQTPLYSLETEISQMRGQFNLLKRTLTQHNGIDPSRLDDALTSFGTQFAPLLKNAIENERRVRDVALERANSFQDWLFWAACAVALIALISLALFQFGLVRPLIRRIGKITQAAQAIGGGAFDQRIEINRRDELGLLFANVNRMAARLGRRRKAVDSDRNRLNAMIDERTEELTRANAQLEQADARRRRFFADVSHELRTPLTVILGEADLGMRSPNMDEEQTRSSMTLIHTRARRLNRRIDDLLRVARSESGEIELVSAPFDLTEAARDAASDLKAVTQRRRISINVNTELPHIVIGDRDWTRQIISGLLDNSVRHSPDGSTINIALRGRSTTTDVCIEDKGEGIPATEQSTIFKRFQRGNGTKDQTGFGVGLSLAKWVVERQDGSITLLSPVNENAGTRVTLTLPSNSGEDRHDA